MLDHKKELSELFELTSVARKSSFDIVASINAGVQPEQLRLMFKDFRTALKLVNDKVEDCKRAMDRNGV